MRSLLKQQDAWTAAELQSVKYIDLFDAIKRADLIKSQIPASASAGTTTADNWKETEKGRRTAREEALRLRWYAQRGRIENIGI